MFVTLRFSHSLVADPFLFPPENLKAIKIYSNNQAYVRVCLLSRHPAVARRRLLAVTVHIHLNAGFKEFLY